MACPVADLVVEDDAFDALHPGTETTSPNESNALVTEKEVRAVPIDFLQLVTGPLWHLLAAGSRSSAAIPR